MSDNRTKYKPVEVFQNIYLTDTQKPGFIACRNSVTTLRKSGAWSNAVNKSKEK